MNKPKVISLRQAVEALERLAKAVRETGDDSGGRAGVIVESLRGPVVHGIQLAIEQLKALEQYEVNVVCTARIVEKYGIPEQMWDAAEDQTIRRMTEEFGEYARKEGLIDVVTDHIPGRPPEYGTRVTMRAAFIQKVEPQAYTPQYRGHCMTAEQFNAIWNDNEGEDDGV